MKKIILNVFLLINIVVLYGQTDSSTPSRNVNKKEELNKFIAKITGISNDNPITNFVLDLDNSPEIKFNAILNKKNTFNQFYIDGNITSSNDYTPLIKKGEWLPDLGINLNYTRFFRTTTKFYSSYVDDIGGNVNEATIDNASQLFWIWFTVKAGYNYSTLKTYNDNFSFLNKDKITQYDMNNFLFKPSISFYSLPSAKKSIISWSGTVSLEYKTNDNNYSSLKTVTVNEIETITDQQGNIIEVKSKEENVREGEIITQNNLSLNYNIVSLISSLPKGEDLKTRKDLFAFNFFGKTNLISGLKSTNIGLGVTVPLSVKGQDSKTNFTLKYEIEDVFKELSNLTFKERGVLGFTIGISMYAK